MKRPLLALAASLLIVSPASALTSSTLDFMDRNGIYYYNPDGYADGCYAGTGSYDGVASTGLTDLQSAFVDKFAELAIQLGSEYGIPWITVMAQGIVESTSGTSRFARERNNFFGIGAFDSNPNAAKSYSTPAEGWKGYFENIKNTPTYRAHGAFDYPNDPYGYLKAIKSAGYATDENYIEKISKYITAIINRAEEKGWPTSVSSSTASLHSCNSTSQGNGDLNATALSLSWPDRSHSLTDPKPEYRNALSVVGLANYGEQWVRIGASCDAFVATVLRFSGADPDVVCCGAANMLHYFMSHPEKYQEIPNLGNPSNLQPGDIRAKPSHVEMYVIDESSHGKIASASHADRTADHYYPYYSDSSYRIFRVRRNN